MQKENKNNFDRERDALVQAGKAAMIIGLIVYGVIMLAEGLFCLIFNYSFNPFMMTPTLMYLPMLGAFFLVQYIRLRDVNRLVFAIVIFSLEFINVVLFILFLLKLAA